jgi:Tol biopolymer transport system component/predicted Ser/Thr protein kinase
MTPERWQQIDKLLGQALEQEPERRAAFLDQACAGDEELHREVASLLQAHGQAGSRLSSPAFELAGRQSADSQQTLMGQRLGHYQILFRLGEGGMGIVYKARDQHLDRFVAIKVLPPELVADPDRKRRFVQEAKAASALNHPNIITIHDIASDNGRDFIVMEYVEGKTLGELIPRRGMKLEEALKVAIQLADALAKAHAAGIIHRDLKPGNIMLTEESLVKILDFGLAKLAENPLPGGEPTRTAQSWTAEGMIVGTASYMSPEQAAGKPVDARSDIFSFGSVLYEMVTGQRAFQGDSTMSIVSAVLREEPKPAGEVVSGIPPQLESILQRCLRKDPERRFQHMDDVKVFLEEVLEKAASEKPQEVNEAAARKPRQRVLMGGLLACLAALFLAVWLWHTLRPSDLPPMTTVPLTTYPGHERSPSFSPDGNQVAFSWNGEKQDNFDIYVKLIGAEDPLRLTHDAAEDSSPAWSPDGRWIAFLRDLGEGRASILLIPPVGGPEKRVHELYKPWMGWGFPLTWSPEGDSLVIVDRESDSKFYGLFVLSLESGEKCRLTSPPVSIRGDFSPAFSPDGRDIAFVRAVDWESVDLYLLPVDKGLRPMGEPERLTIGQPRISNHAWVKDGREIIFSDFAVGTFDLGHLWRVAATGSGKPQRLVVGENGFGLSMSQQRHRLVYSREVADVNIWRLGLSDQQEKTAKQERFIFSTQADTNPQISPDGKKVVFSSNRAGTMQIWTCDYEGTNPERLTSFGKGQSASPRWSPDSAWVSFDSNKDGQWDVYVVDAQGGNLRRLTSHPAEDANPSWSRDGKWIYFNSNRSGSYQVWKIPSSGGEATQFTQQGGFLALESPDGKFVYYMKGDNDRRIWRTSTQGGAETQILGPIFRRDYDVAKDGIYFIPGPDSSRDNSIRFVSFATGEIKTIASIGNAWGNYISVSPDGRWILYPKLEMEGSDLMLVENFR